MRGKPLSLCAKNHEPMAYTAAACPLCAALARIHTLIVSQQAVQDRRCADCTKGPAKTEVEAR